MVLRGTPASIYAQSQPLLRIIEKSFSGKPLCCARKPNGAMMLKMMSDSSPVENSLPEFY